MNKLCTTALWHINIFYEEFLSNWYFYTGQILNNTISTNINCSLKKKEPLGPFKISLEGFGLNVNVLVKRFKTTFPVPHNPNSSVLTMSVLFFLSLESSLTENLHCKSAWGMDMGLKCLGEESVTAILKL